MNSYIVSQKKFERKYPEEKAKIESKEFPIDSEKDHIEKTDGITQKEMKDSLYLSVQDGERNKKVPTYPQYFYDPLKTGEFQKDNTMLIGYQKINEEKRRMTSGKRIVLTEKEFAIMPQLEKVKLQGDGDFYMLFPQQFSHGNIELTSSNSGKSRKVMSEIFNGVSGS